MNVQQSLLPTYGIAPSLFDGYTVQVSESECAPFRFVVDAEFYVFRLNVHEVWKRITTYRNAVNHLLKTDKIYTHHGIENAKDFLKVYEAEARAMEVPASVQSVLFSLKRLASAINTNMPSERAKLHTTWLKCYDIINQFTLKYQNQ